MYVHDLASVVLAAIYNNWGEWSIIAEATDSVSGPFGSLVFAESVTLGILSTLLHCRWAAGQRR